MQTLTVIPDRGGQRNRPKTPRPIETVPGKIGLATPTQASAPVNLQRHPRPHTHSKMSGRVRKYIRRAFTPLIDAKAASRLLGVPYTWLLAQAREGKIPHHRLGHYVRFDPDDLQTWLRETRAGAPTDGQRHT
jgi:excisionase family DNA binding protein